ncbi:hypothetical protein [Alkaliphilus crotonatoxidans]
MKPSTLLFLNTLHGIFIGLVLGLTLAIGGSELITELKNSPLLVYLIPALVVFFGLLGLIKGYNNLSGLLFPLFSTPGTILLPIISISVLYFLIGFDRLLALPPIVFKEGFGLAGMNTQLSTYILAFILSLTFVAAFISSHSINKKKRWTW